MGIFSFLKKDKKGSELPPPPPPPLKFDELESELARTPQAPLPSTTQPTPNMKMSNQPLSAPAPTGPISSEPQAPLPQAPPAPMQISDIPLITAADFTRDETEEPAPRPQPAPQASPPTNSRTPAQPDKPRMIEDKTVHTQPDLKLREKRTTPVFVSAQDYTTIQNGVQSIRNTLAESESTIMRLGELKTQQDRILGDWKTTLTDMEKKLAYIDSVIFTGE